MNTDLRLSVATQCGQFYHAMIILAMMLLPGLSDAHAQFPFEKFPVLEWKQAGPWEVHSRVEKEGKIHWTIKLPDFYKDSSSITVQLTSLARHGTTNDFVFATRDTSTIRIYRDKRMIQVMEEPFPLGVNFGFLHDSLRYADINGDSLTDLKITSWAGGNGLAAYWHRVIYLFQRTDGKFEKISFINMELPNHSETDLDGDGNYEIVVTHHAYHKDHSYWVFNVYRVDGGRWHCVNEAFDYPILVQMLYRRNYDITNKLTRKEMKQFEKKLPDDFSGRRF